MDHNIARDVLSKREDFGTALKNFLQNPYASQVCQTSDGCVTIRGYLLAQVANIYQLVAESIWASIGTSIGFTILLAIGFSLLRPYNSVVYAPKLKHADEKHCPPAVGKGLFAWVKPVWQTSEQDLLVQIGLDATIFLRFTRMCRNMFSVLAVIGCGILLPTYLVAGGKVSSAFQNVSLFSKLTPLYTFDQPNWAQVVVAWLFNVVICGFLWWNYRAVLRLRRQYFDSPEYQRSMHARTLMVRSSRYSSVFKLRTAANFT